MVVFRVAPPAGLSFWAFARNHLEAYNPMVAEWNRKHPEMAFRTSLIVPAALQRRLLSGFLSGTPVPDVVEIERSIVGSVFGGPEEDIGLIDLGPLLAAEGILEQLNPPSLSPWTHQGKLYGVPHDVHPVLLAYRADLVEAAGIDVNRIATWQDFAREMAPLMADRDSQGRPRRYLLNIWETNRSGIEALLRQAGGGTFDADGRLAINSEINARVLATIVSWTTGPDRIAVDAPEMTASGNQLRLDGTVIACLLPDWLAGIWKSDIPDLAGKIKLMPLPAWEPGGRRTSVSGGSMIGIPKRSRDPAAALAFIKYLYLNPQLAELVFRTTNIIPAVRSFWDLPVFSEPDPFFSGQPAGQLFIAQAGDVPLRVSTAFDEFALSEVVNATQALKNFANRTGTYDAEDLLPEAQRQLARAHSVVAGQMARNVFSRPDS